MKKTLQELEREKSILEKRIYNLKNREYYNVHKIGRLRDRTIQIDKEIRNMKHKKIFADVFSASFIGGNK